MRYNISILPVLLPLIISVSEAGINTESDSKTSYPQNNPWDPRSGFQQNNNETVEDHEEENSEQSQPEAQ